MFSISAISPSSYLANSSFTIKRSATYVFIQMQCLLGCWQLLSHSHLQGSLSPVVFEEPDVAAAAVMVFSGLLIQRLRIVPPGKRIGATNRSIKESLIAICLWCCITKINTQLIYITGSDQKLQIKRLFVPKLLS